MTADIKKLNSFQHARLRCEMYLGSRDPNTQTIIDYIDQKPVLSEMTWVPAVFTAFREILDNALDEVITHKQGNTIRVDYDPKTMIFKVFDNGRGIPIAYDEGHKQHLATMAMSETMAGRNFEDRGASRGLNGVGASIVNLCSSFMQLDIYRDGQHFSQNFHDNKGKATNLVIEPPVIFPDKRKETGTTVEFQLSPLVFKNMELPEKFIQSRILEIALIYNGALKVYYNGELIKLPKGNAIKTLFPAQTIQVDIVRGDIFKAQYFLVPEFSPDGGEYQHSLVNAIPTFNGGTHIDSFKTGFYKGILVALEKESKKRKLNPNRSDLADGMLIYNVTEMAEPSFDSQNKSRMITEGVAKIIREELDNADFFKNIIKKYPDWIESVYARCAERTKAKDSADAQKLAKRNLRTKVEDLRDACGSDRTKCMLFLAEGNSAISGMSDARDANIHGGLPLRGKVLNVFGQHPKDILANEALAKIMNSIGLTPLVRPNRYMLRYGKVFITTDADEDGKNISALLINFFYTCWPELFDPNKPPFIYLFDTPLLIAVKGKVRKYWYNDNYHEFDPDDYKGWKIIRAKGLARLTKEDWKMILANPKVIPVIDDGNLAETLDLIFNTGRADNRKEWIGM